MIIVIDNYDSFTYNLVQYLGMLGAKITVFRNDQVGIKDIEKMSFQGLVISPGPGVPEKAGICRGLIRKMSGRVPILGVCLGHQCIGEVFGLSVVQAQEPMHGKTCLIDHVKQGLFKGIPQGIRVARYHSLVLEEREGLSSLAVTAKTSEGTVMAVQHRTHPTFGVQFHPESIATEYGFEVLQNFLSCC